MLNYAVYYIKKRITMIQTIMVNYKLNDDIHNPRYISDGMNEFERNMKRMLDFVVALVCLVVLFFACQSNYVVLHTIFACLFYQQWLICGAKVHKII